MSERTYTLAEAREALRLQDCATYGHDFSVVQAFGGEPQHILCDRCGKSWKVQEEAA